MPQKIVIEIGTDGVVRYVDHPVLERAFGKHAHARQSKRRASHVVPCNWFLRAAFVVIRKCVKDDSAAAEWTRKFPGRWRVDMRPSGGKVFGRFKNRDEAISAEIEWLQANRFGRTVTTA